VRAVGALLRLGRGRPGLLESACRTSLMTE
jgi:hypothetical protein